MSTQWTRRITGISGSRWFCCQAYSKERIEITCPKFKEEVVQHSQRPSVGTMIVLPAQSGRRNTIVVAIILTFVISRY